MGVDPQDLSMHINELLSLLQMKQENFLFQLFQKSGGKQVVYAK